MTTPSFKANPGQDAALALLTKSQRHTLIKGGARSGKTFLFLRSVVVRALRAPESRHAILRYRANAVRSSIALDTLPKVMRLCFPDVVLKEHRQDGYFEIRNSGSQIWLGGLDDKERVEKILGQEYLTIYFNECSQIPYSSVIIARTRLAQVSPGLIQRAYYDMNPTGTGHWTYREFEEHKDPVSGRPLADPEDYQIATINPGDNAENLSPEFLRSLANLPEKQRRRFYEGQYVAEVDGALWTIEIIERSKLGDKESPPEMKRIVVSVDPSGASGNEDERSDEIGIVVVGLGVDNIAYLLEDCSLRAAPEVWGKAVKNAFHKWQADLVIAEKNFGGDMVRFVIQTADRKLPVKVINAARGKHVRAEPISALYEQNRVRHARQFPEIEDQLLNFSSSGYAGERSPDRADALVWGITELALAGGESVFDIDDEDVLIDPIRIPSHWTRVYGLDFSRSRGVIVWAAFDEVSDVLYVYDEHVSNRAEPALLAEAARKKGRWIPGITDTAAHGRSTGEAAKVETRLGELQLDLMTVAADSEASVNDLADRLSTGRLKVFSTAPNIMNCLRSLRREENGDLPDECLLVSLGLLALFGRDVAISEAKASNEIDDESSTDRTRSSTTGY